MIKSSNDARYFSDINPVRNSFFLRAVGTSLLILATFLLPSCNDQRPTVDISSTADREVSLPVMQDDRSATLRIAVGAMISPEITREYYQDLMELVAAQVDRRAVFSQRRTYAEINELVKNHEVDVAFVCSGPYTSGHKDFGMELLVVPVAHGQKIYHSYILTRNDSSIQSFEELRNKRFAFTDPHSNTGCLVPTYMLAKRGETPESFFATSFCTSSHDNSIKAVADGLADGAAVDSLIWEFMNTVDPADTSRTKIIEKSPPYGIPPIVVHPDLDDTFKKHLKRAFLSLHEKQAAIPLLRKIQIDRFAETEDSMYDSVREMEQWLDNFNNGKKP